MVPRLLLLEILLMVGWFMVFPPCHRIQYTFLLNNLDLKKINSWYPAHRVLFLALKSVRNSVQEASWGNPTPVYLPQPGVNLLNPDPYPVTVFERTLEKNPWVEPPCTFFWAKIQEKKFETEQIPQRSLNTHHLFGLYCMYSAVAQKLNSIKKAG